MSVETKKVLEMLAAGKITSEDAERLLDELAAKEPVENNTSENQEGSGPTPARKVCGFWCRMATPTSTCACRLPSCALESA